MITKNKLPEKPKKITKKFTPIDMTVDYDNDKARNKKKTSKVKKVFLLILQSFYYLAKPQLHILLQNYLCLNFLKLTFPQQLQHFTLPPAVYEDAKFSTFSTTLIFLLKFLSNLPQ